MSIFQNNPDGFPAVRKKMIRRMIPLIIILVLFGLVTSIPVKGHFIQSFLFYGLLIAVIVYFTFRKLLRHQKKIYDSYILTIDDRYISRTEFGTPNAVLAINDITRIVELPDRGLLIVGTPAAPGVTYGKPVTADKAITLASLSKKLNSDSVYNGKISGKVVEVCTKKGCFMKLSQTNGGSLIMVRFTNYGFFMPQNIVGQTVVVEGKAKVSETTVERLKHYAKDAGKSQQEIAKINAPQKDIQIMADGVLVM